MKNRVLSMVLAVVMVVSLIPVIAISVGANSDAIALTIGTQTSGLIDAENTEMWYSIQLTEAGRLTLGFSSSSGAEGIDTFTVTWFTAESTQISSDTYNRTTVSSHNQSMFLEAGLYYVRLARRQYSSGNDGTYSITPAFVAAGKTEMGNNVSRNEAFELELDEKVTGFINYESGSVNWYSVTLTEAGRLTLGFSSEAGVIGIDTVQVTLFTDLENTEIRNYSYTRTTVSTNNTSMFLESGTYYIRVSKRAYSSGNEGAYSITPTFIAAGKTETGNNVSRNEAFELELDEKTTGFINYESGSVNWYSVTLPEAGRLTLGFSSEAGEIGIDTVQVTLFTDPENTEIRNYSYTRTTVSTHNTSMFLKAGTYYIRVSKRAYSSGNEGAYDITPTFISAGKSITFSNDSINNALPLESKEGVTGFITYESGSVAWYSVKLDSKRELKLQVASDTGAIGIGTVNITLFRSADSQVHSYSYTRETVSTHNYSVELEPGTYYIRVQKRSYSSNNEGSYVLTADYSLPDFTLGDVDGNGVVAIADALEILKYLAGMNSVVNQNNTTAWNAARITGGATPAIGDVLEILKKLAGMTSMLG